MVRTLDRLLVNECFVSLQGEGRLVGTPSSFIRIAGCNLRCAWCDSRATSWEPEGTRTSVDELVAFCARGPRHVVLTGGEPLLMRQLAPLSQRLTAAGHHITIETAATLWLDDVEHHLLSLSPKLAHATPRDDEKWSLLHEQRRHQPALVRRWMDSGAWQLKLVVRVRAAEDLEHDLEEIEHLLRHLDVSPPERGRVFLMPECIDPAQLPAAYATLSPICLDRGFSLGQRLHIQLYGHTPGT